ncbi:histidine kinase [Frankia sp. EAN1pec]|uniref:histidine kinase n=1 Tax=Parafrankia sp. (strain EAN1pec) TaxID=298653 RepID=UPI00030CFB92
MTDAFIALVVFALGVAVARWDPSSNFDPVTPNLVASVVGCGALVLRRRRPAVVLGVLLACVAGLFALTTTVVAPPLTLATGVALHSVAVRRSRETAWISALCATAVLLPPALMQDRAILLVIVGLITWTVAPTAVGDSARSRRAHVAAMVDRALRAEQSREEEARRQVAEERLRIARELHDVIAHHITLVKVQASVASHLLCEEPSGAEEALGHIRHASRTVLEELRSLVTVLRDTGEPASTEPPPGLARLPELLASFEASGMPVSFRTAGTPRELPALADLAAYRIVQESLTNAHKHARGGRTRVDIGYFDQELRLHVHNTIRAEADVNPILSTGPHRGRPLDRGGHGIAGMRERMTALGGRLRAGPDPDGGFAVSASMPLPE